jgi:2-dehydropantoate 2-reductase
MCHAADVRYIIYGAGAVGGTIGGRLFQHDHEVVLIGRGAHYQALRDGGLHLQSPDESVVLAVAVVERPDQIEHQPGDIVFLAMKSQDTATALDALIGWAGPELPVVCAQNGVANERAALRLFANVYGMCVFLPATHLQPGVVQCNSTPVAGILDLGRCPSGGDPLAEEVAAALRASDFDSRVEPDIMRRKYGKLLNNLGNALDAACGSATRRGELYARARAEATACFEAAGIDFASAEEDRARRTARGGRGVPLGRALPEAQARSRPTISTARSCCSDGSTGSRLP